MLINDLAIHFGLSNRFGFLICLYCILVCVYSKKHIEIPDLSKQCFLNMASWQAIKKSW